MLCNLCPRQCNALRTETAGEGYCRMPAAPVAARAALHMWEEPPISGTRGSGTIFFSGCSLGCVFCQNEKISHQDFGRPVTVERLREICLELVAQGAHNINFVNPPLRPRGAPGAGGAPPCAGGVELRGLRPGGDPESPGGPGVCLPPRFQVSGPGDGGAVLRRSGLPPGGPGCHSGDGPADGSLSV